MSTIKTTMYTSIPDNAVDPINYAKQFWRFCVEYEKGWERPAVLIAKFTEAVRRDRMRKKLDDANKGKEEDSSEESSSEESSSEEAPPPPRVRRSRRGRPAYKPTIIHLANVQKGMARGLTQKQIEKKYGMSRIQVQRCAKVIKQDPCLQG